jgi:hypothetical protein
MDVDLQLELHGSWHDSRLVEQEASQRVGVSRSIMQSRQKDAVSRCRIASNPAIKWERAAVKYVRL